VIGKAPICVTTAWACCTFIRWRRQLVRSMLVNSSSHTAGTWATSSRTSFRKRCAMAAL